LFLLAGDDLGQRIYFKGLFSQQHPLMEGNWLRTEHVFQMEPPYSALLHAGKELIEFVTTGQMGEPEFGPSFPAQKIETDRNWDDLVLPSETKNDIQDIISWVTHEQQVMKEWRLAEKVSPGFRCLFHGPPGTGKTFTATLLGKATGRDVYRIDLSMVVSKYIGETEKNLKVVFDKAQSRGWILFFDEADALFGKRTDVSDSKDRYANQEVSYLLQRVESFDGVVILATNNRDNMDKAFTRRFQVVVNFPMPNANERLRLWETGMPEAFELAPTVNLLAIADRYEMAGGSIMNVIRHCALRAAMRGAPTIEEFDMVDGIRREFRKAGRILN
jgi:SpoVK/Ycf46/Vps4 family AAA+-type ATPase